MSLEVTLCMGQISEGRLSGGSECLISGHSSSWTTICLFEQWQQSSRLAVQMVLSHFADERLGHFCFVPLSGRIEYTRCGHCNRSRFCSGRRLFGAQETLCCTGVPIPATIEGKGQTETVDRVAIVGGCGLRQINLTACCDSVVSVAAREIVSSTLPCA